MSRPPLTQRQMTEREWSVEITLCMGHMTCTSMHTLCKYTHPLEGTWVMVCSVLALFVWFMYVLFACCLKIVWELHNACLSVHTCVCVVLWVLPLWVAKLKTLCRFDNASKTWTCIKKSQQILLEEYNKLLQSMPEWFQHYSLLLYFHHSFYSSPSSSSTLCLSVHLSISTFVHRTHAHGSIR